VTQQVTGRAEYRQQISHQLVTQQVTRGFVQVLCRINDFPYYTYSIEIVFKVKINGFKPFELGQLSKKTLLEHYPIL
jgi:hypothetical protein